MISDYDFRANKISESNSDDSTGEGEIETGSMPMPLNASVKTSYKNCTRSFKENCHIDIELEQITVHTTEEKKTDEPVLSLLSPSQGERGNECVDISCAELGEIEIRPPSSSELLLTSANRGNTRATYAEIALAAALAANIKNRNQKMLQQLKHHRITLLCTLVGLLMIIIAYSLCPECGKRELIILLAVVGVSILSTLGVHLYLCHETRIGIPREFERRRNEILRHQQL
ncbi:putative membrane protein [Candidatus Ichthyocystis hellenicum]|uniref:Putative membrane protein n=1 Tax=Candidatus Ichthyocystis hellenicum TaxID=1561003 RepID=A0A0S4M3G5_9BURK|nr:hypothetical protein [Candidatus Ichthyocystis hellenicum]CUT18313.1 putative membrane protein [Candidatus Ichthyocystis hellenicum]